MHDQLIRARDKKQYSGALFFDLSACFDTVNPEVFCRKLALYGFDSKSITWMFSYLSDRWQIVSISGEMSNKIQVHYGCPQGSCLSPIIFLILVADIALWTETAKNYSFADDTSSVVSGDG